MERTLRNVAVFGMSPMILGRVAYGATGFVEATVPFHNVIEWERQMTGTGNATGSMSFPILYVSDANGNLTLRQTGSGSIHAILAGLPALPSKGSGRRFSADIHSFDRCFPGLSFKPGQISVVAFGLKSCTSCGDVAQRLRQVAIEKGVSAGVLWVEPPTSR